MKIGIITLTEGQNYGNVLQNYAVQEVLCNFGASAETIINISRVGRNNYTNKKVCKFTPSYIKRYFKTQLSYRYNIKNTGNGVFHTLFYCKKNAVALGEAKQKRIKAFADFTDTYINHSENVFDINYPWTREQVNEYDFYVSGSDQVWNPIGSSYVDFLQFAPKAKRIALSPSFGVNEIPENLKKQYAEWLKEIPFLSVREDRGREIVKELCGKDIPVLCDPTMLLSREKWLEIAKKPSFLGDTKYILTYFLGDRTKKYQKYIDNIVSQTGYEVINLFDVLDLNVYSASPNEFIYLIKNAELVLTDSFHGAVFSILMNTNFVTFPRVEIGGSMESRIKTLLKTFSLEERDFRALNLENLFKTDFSNIDITLQAKRKEAFDFLERALSSKPNEETLKSVYSYNKRDCCGCSACANACPKNCIEMKQDAEGFLYPEIDHKKCVNCSICNSVCPLQNKISICNDVKTCYVAYSLNNSVRKLSSSGGVFSEIANSVIQSGGVVFGAAFDNNFKVVHTLAYTNQDLGLLRGSKYVQSDIRDSYVKVKELLENGTIVYFSGTPCQIKGLKTYLGIDYKNLITQDLICHGVPSPLVLDKYLQFVDKSVKEVSFRHKKFGWHYFSMMIKGRKKHIKRLDEDIYLRLFLDNTILRPSCYDCLLKKEGSCADITLADAWSLKSIGAKVKDNDKGLSLVSINTEKGRSIWDNIGNDVLFKEKVDTNSALSSQKAINTSVSPNKKRAIFFEKLTSEDSKTLFNDWYKKNPIAKAKRYIVFVKTKLYKLIR